MGAFGYGRERIGQASVVRAFVVERGREGIVLERAQFWESGKEEKGTAREHGEV